jgi:hypothetical protein
MNSPNPDTPDNDEDAAAAAPRFVNWLGFLLVGVAVNLLFLWGIRSGMEDAGVAAWTKVLSWLPFNLIATMFYLVCYAKVANWLFRLLALAMIILNWLAFFAA